MKKTFIWIVLLASVSGLIQLSGCGGDPEPDPCLDKSPVEAKFIVGELLPLFEGKKSDTVVVSDTVLTNNSIVFEATEEYESYEWKIGDDPRVFNTKRIKLLFPSPVSQLAVKLTVKRTPLKNCFPDDDGIDTKIKFVTIIAKKVNPIFGQYEGGNESNPNDIFKIEVTHDTFYDQINILNINKNCYPIDESIGLRGLSTAMGYKKLYFFSGFYYKLCNDPQGWLTVDKSGKNVEVLYSTGNGSTTQTATKRINEKFKGKRLN